MKQASGPGAAPVFDALALARATRAVLAARGDDPLMPPILDAVKAYATLGEMCGVLREEWGEYTPPTVV